MIFRKIISFLTYTNIWISSGSALFTWFFYLLMETDPDHTVSGFIFSSTLLTYTFQRYMKMHYNERGAGPRMEWMINHSLFIKALLFISLLAAICFSLFLSLFSLLLLSLLAAISFFYAFKFKLTSRRTNLRDIPGIKIFLIGLVWACTCAIIPAIELNQLTPRAWQISIGYFCFIVGLTIPFDIRDMNVDHPSKKTIPQMIGVNASKVISIFLVLFSSVFLVKSTDQFLAFSPAIALTVTLVIFTQKSRDEFYFSFILDGLLIAIPIIYYALMF